VQATGGTCGVSPQYSQIGPGAAICLAARRAMATGCIGECAETKRAPLPTLRMAMRMQHCHMQHCHVQRSGARAHLGGRMAKELGRGRSVTRMRKPGTEKSEQSKRACTRDKRLGERAEYILCAARTERRSRGVCADLRSRKGARPEGAERSGAEEGRKEGKKTEQW